MLRRYSLTDFENIINSGIVYILDQSIINIIQQLADQVGAPEYVRTPQFSRNDTNSSSRLVRKDRHSSQTEKGGLSTNFITSNRPKSEGIDASIDLIRKILNKITTKTYNELFPTLLEELDKLECLNDDEMSRIGDLIISIVSETSFYSDMYAKLYAVLHMKYLFLHKILSKLIGTFKHYTEGITYCNPDINYDEFCKNNKENTRRRSIAVFFVNLVKEGIVGIEQVCDIIEHLQKNISLKLTNENQREIIDELSEISGDMIISGKDVLNISERWENIVEFAETVSKMKVKNYVSLSTKAIFKHMDILDAIN